MDGAVEGAGRDHPDILTARANLARWTEEAGMWPGPATASLVPLSERVLGTDHPDTLVIRQIVICLDGSRGADTPVPG